MWPVPSAAYCGEGAQGRGKQIWGSGDQGKPRRSGGRWPGGARGSGWPTTKDQKPHATGTPQEICLSGVQLDISRPPLPIIPH
ncbi:hypothetical protein GUJ93_ZPchr0013g34252 [Zizania palustris]|uniref:Uncharacterized protein n=1 Tax=Zizania palustris TaxID=103762 RepID=A0A8J5X578_ZIZPA|nr:hypothetical protein GUJ93_ZPchr0013g34252 [Zizania palustris]